MLCVLIPKTNEEKQHQAANSLAKVDLHSSGIRYQEIECMINGDYTIHGRREGQEVYLPFTFLEKYFEVYGKIAEYDGLVDETVNYNTTLFSVLPKQWSAGQMPVKTAEDQSKFFPSGPAGWLVASSVLQKNPYLLNVTQKLMD